MFKSHFDYIPICVINKGYNMKKLIALATVITMATAPAFAGVGDYIPSGLELGLGLSATTGLNGFVGYANKNHESFWWKRLGVRFDFASTAPIKKAVNNALGNAIQDIELGDNGIRIDGGSLESKHFAALVDIYPFGNTWFLGGWRLTGGYMFGSFNLQTNLTGEIDGLPAGKYAFVLDGQKYYYEGNSVHGTADLKWKLNGPYAGTGFDIGLFRGFKIYLDAGVVFTSKAAEIGLNVPFTNLHKENGDPVQGNAALENVVNTAKANAIREAQDELNKYKFFPMVKLGFMYRF